MSPLPFRLSLCLFQLSFLCAFAMSQDRPNVIIVITDDQGYGDLACHGNEMIETPSLDRLHSESVRFTDFHVDPTCSPTRAALLSGQYSTKTGVWHTILGRSILFPDVQLMPEIFRANGYRTGIFGKWHLGDNFPARPQDRGFDEVLIHGGGGIGQTPDYWGNDYFSDTYLRNGVWEKHYGYCTDVFFDEAMSFIDESEGQPFFLYLPLNVPHGPFNVADRYTEKYLDRGVPERMAKFYGMIENFDENLGRMREWLRERSLDENTIFIFLTDNGTAAGNDKGRKHQERDAWSGFNAGMRGNKGSQYDGGHRVPLFINDPIVKGKGRDVSALTAHFDLLPTLVERCDLELPKGASFDGRSLVSLLEKGKKAAFPERTLFVHFQREDIPPKWVKSSVMTPKWRLVDGEELYEIAADPGQEKDLSSRYPEIVSQLRREYEAWWASLEPAMQRDAYIEIGTEAEPVSLINCMDWHSEQPVPWNQELIAQEPWVNGFWLLNVSRSGRYEVSLRLYPKEEDRAMEANYASVRIGEVEASAQIDPCSTKVSFQLELRKTGPARMDTVLKDERKGKERGAFYVEVKRLD